ncbi:MAG: hypothetical protein JWM72_526, partial [Actinomycetia bacterium]|nr:hypothetical protein [Actinomycetes bacterium]
EVVVESALELMRTDFYDPAEQWPTRRAFA